MWPLRTGNHVDCVHNGFISCFLISLGTIAFGYPSVIVASTLAKPSFLKYMGLGDENGIYHDKEGMAGTITSVFQAGAVVGILCGCEISDRFGRKNALLYCSIISIIGGIGVTAAQNMAMLLVFRFFAGAGSFAYLALAPGYISELATPNMRGFFGGLCGVFLGFGYCCGGFMGLAFYYAQNEALQWRGPFGIGIIWPLITLIVCPFIPESPRYLLMKNKPDVAWEVMAQLRAGPGEDGHMFALAEFSQMKQQAAFDRALDGSWMQLIKKPSYRKRVILASGVSFLGQSTAVLVLNNYGPIFYSALGFDTRDQLILAGARDTIAFLGNIVGAVLLDNVGRRRMLLTGFGGCLVTLCVFAATVAEVEKHHSMGTVGVGITALFAFLVFFAMGVDAPTYVFMSEIFPSHMRSKGMAVAIAIYALSAIVYLQVTPMAVSSIGWKYFLVFICITAVGWVWMYFEIFETKKIPLEEMGEKFGDADEVVVHLSETLAEADSKRQVVHPEEPQKEGKQVPAEHLEYSNKSLTISEPRAE
ncbi:general substrate transporter [Talaromyces proteolyticus]|uniref:General substrate transporter n=1 Tax=Talaromyces proteolyticus TaxID=1131652 RepID=A0AAD4Q0Y0_9EURO|nr:general substrate transporter [Talaromyces proteolyticus]KAH8697922.1 general substrate transporter [Talaromyces proteolyticus]